MHRRPGDGSTLSQMEQAFPITQQWVQAEAQAPAGADEGQGNGSDASGDGHSFTRVVIGELKPDVLQQLADADKGAQVCRWAGGCGVAAIPCLHLPESGIKLAGTCSWAAACNRWKLDRKQAAVLHALPSRCMMVCRPCMQGLGTSLSLLPPWRAGQSPARQ